MTYAETLQWLFAQLPMYQRVGGANYKFDLQKTHQLMDVLGHPEQNLTCIHVAGTNGKGSTSHMLASVLQEKGLRVGLYTSPHLIDFRERIKIDGEMISEDEVVAFVSKYKDAFVQLELSFFEMTVGLAFDHFQQKKTDIAIVEVGMGGRLDSTNVVDPLVSVITNISLDHTQFLGNTLPKIAAEKGGIIKPHVPVVIGRTQLETKAVFEDIAAYNQSPIIFADQQIASTFQSDLTGIYQQENIQTVVTALGLLPEKFHPTKNEITLGLGKVVANTGLLGRWQILQNNPLVVCDTGHNEDGIVQVLRMIDSTPHKNLHLVWGMVGDKDVRKILSLLPKNAFFYFTQPSIPRALPVEELALIASEMMLYGEKYSNVKDAILSAKQKAHPNDLICIGGSTFVVADALV